MVPEDTPVDLPAAEADLEELDLTEEAVLAGLATLVAEDAEDLAETALVAAVPAAADDLVTDPLRDLDIAALLVPADLDMEPMPFLPAEPVVEILGRKTLSPPPMVPQ